MLRLVDKERFNTARRVFTEPVQPGCVLVDIKRPPAAIYAVESDFTKGQGSAAIVAIARCFGLGPMRGALSPFSPQCAGEGRGRAKPGICERPRAKVRAKSKPSTKAIARRKGVHAEP